MPLNPGTSDGRASGATTPRFELAHLGPHVDDGARALAELRAGFARSPVHLPARLLYDARGSALFDAITDLPEYYPTRAETEILERHAGEIVTRAAPAELFELGSGSSRKTRILIEAALERGCRRYVALDVSASALENAGLELVAQHEELSVRALVADFASGLAHRAGPGPRLVLFLGSTLGNFRPEERRRFLAQLAQSLRPDDRLLLGYDIVKPAAVLELAYDDPAGVTAAFVRNGLHNLARLGGERIPLAAFAYEAKWIPASSHMEMRLVARRDVQIRLPNLDLALDLAAGEFLISEISTKFTRESLARELSDAGLAVEVTFADRAKRFELLLAGPRP